MCAYLNEEVISTSYPHVSIANSINTTRTTTIHFKLIVCIYHRLLKQCVVSRLLSELVDLISILLWSHNKNLLLTCFLFGTQQQTNKMKCIES